MRVTGPRLVVATRHVCSARGAEMRGSFTAAGHHQCVALTLNNGHRLSKTTVQNQICDPSCSCARVSESACLSMNLDRACHQQVSALRACCYFPDKKCLATSANGWLSPSYSVSSFYNGCPASLIGKLSTAKRSRDAYSGRSQAE